MDRISELKHPAQITKRYTAEDIVGKQIIGVVIFPPRRIAGFNSEVLVLGGLPEQGGVVFFEAAFSIA